MHSEALQNVASVLPASLTAFAATVWPTVAGCFASCWPHDQLVLQCLLNYLLGSGTMFVWSMPESSTVRLEVSRSSQCAVQKKI